VSRSRALGVGRVSAVGASRLRALRAAAGGTLLVVVLAGCDLLPLLGGEPFPSFDPDDPFPFPADATWERGRATIELGGETIVLDQLDGDGTYSAELGITVGWTDGGSWHLTYYGFPAVDGIEEEGYLSLDRVFDGEHWVIYDSTRCVTTTDVADETGLEGTATCRDLRWSDYFGSYSLSGVPDFIEGEPAFDAEITFEAR
jgi:hypothetical protein